MGNIIDGQYRYYAFISYKREDEEWARWLQHKLEHYKLPSNLNGRMDLPKDIRPVFRDTSELTPGNLPQQIHEALDLSKYLIVVCSPRSAQSEWVNKEVETFMSMGKTANVIPFIIEGKPFSSDLSEECFPKSILALHGDQEILGANINEMGRDAAAVKVVARMFDIRFDELWQRHEREKLRRRNMVFASVAVFVLAVIGVAFWMYQQRQETLRANWEMMENQARMVAEKSKEEVRKGNTYDAILALLEMIPQNGSRPFVPELEEALRTAYDSLQSREWNYRFFEDCYNSIYFSCDDNYIICEKDSVIEIYETNTMRKTAQFNLADSLRNIPYFLSQDNDSIFFTDSLFVKCYNFHNGQFVCKMNYTNNILNRCADSFCKAISYENMHWISKWRKNKGISDEFEIMDYNPPKQWALLYQHHGDNVEEVKQYCYVIYDCKTKKNVKVIDDFLIEGSGINSTSFSPDGNKLAIEFFNGTGVVIDLISFTSKSFDCEYCANYSSWLLFARNGQLIHSSKYDIIKIHDSQSLSLVDSIKDKWLGDEVIADINSAGDACLINDNETGMICYKFRKNENMARNGSFNSLVIPWNLSDIIINQRFHILNEDGNLSCKDVKGEYKEWSKKGRGKYLELKGFFQDDNYMLVLGTGPMDVQYGIDIIDVATGITVYHFLPDFYIDQIYYNKKSEQLAFGNDKGPFSDCVIEFPSFDRLLSLCRKATQHMVLTNEARRRFYLSKSKE